MKVLGAATLAIGCAIGFAPSAAADDQAYLNSVVPRYAAYTPQQLLNAGYKVCAFIAPGRAAPTAVPMVVEDLKTSTSIATDIVAAAIVELPC